MCCSSAAHPGWTKTYGILRTGIRGHCGWRADTVRVTQNGGAWWWWSCLYLEVAFIIYIQFVQDIVIRPQLNYLFAGDGEKGLGYTVYLHACPGEEHAFGKHKILLLLQTCSTFRSFCIKFQPERTLCTVTNRCSNTVGPTWLSLLRFCPRMGR